jgi:uncharacterized membrane protein
VKWTGRWFHLWLLLLWIAVGFLLRFLNLAEKPLWADEFATMVFSLGHSFRTIPLDQILTSQQLLQPLQFPVNGLDHVTEHLLTESNHPPFYFLCANLWLRLFSAGGTSSGELASAWMVRSLSALFGVAAIPAMYIFGWQAFRSHATAHLAALLMALSPFGIYLAQEARHYTLPVLWIIASLSYLLAATRSIVNRTPMTIQQCLGWIVVNGLGIATHYFFGLTLIAEAAVIVSVGLVQSWRERGMWHPIGHWKRLGAVALGTTMAGLVWLPFWQEAQDSELTRWLFEGESSPLDPLWQSFAGWVTMLYLLPIQAREQPLVGLSGVVLVGLALWTLPKVYWGLRSQSLRRDMLLTILVLGQFVTVAIAIFFVLTYFYDIELIGVFRYNFVYFPAVLLLVAAALSSGWYVAREIAQAKADATPPALLKVMRLINRRAIAIILLCSLVGGLTVVFNLGYQKTHAPDVVARAIESRVNREVSARETPARETPAREVSARETLVAIVHRTHGQTGRLMGIATSLQKLKGAEVKYLLAHDQADRQDLAVKSLRRSLQQLPRPFDLWLINFHEVPEAMLRTALQQQQCDPVWGKVRSVDGYRYQVFECGKNKT